MRLVVKNGAIVYGARVTKPHQEWVQFPRNPFICLDSLLAVRSTGLKNRRVVVRLHLQAPIYEFSSMERVTAYEAGDRGSTPLTRAILWVLEI